MTDAKEILALIESVDPSDAKAMDEIDARVVAYLKGVTYIDNYPGVDENILFSKERFEDSCPQYTRSRDALKRIRPEGWVYEQTMYHNGLCASHLYKGGVDEVYGKQLPTEELSELSAVIQAIQYERKL